MKASVNLSIITVVVAGLAGSLSSCQQSSHAKSETSRPAPLRVQTTPVVPTTTRTRLTLSGTIEADRATTLGFSVGGRISRVLVGEGQAVRQGQLLAQLDAAELRQSVAIADAALAKAQDTYGRLESLYRSQSIPEKDYVEAKLAVAQARASRAQAAEQLAHTRLYAPFGGVIALKSAEIGMNKAPGEAAFTLVKLDRVMANVPVPEPQIGLVTAGQSATVTVGSTGGTYTGTVRHISPVADANAKTYPVKIALANPGGRLLPGMLADVRVQTGRQTTALTVPPQALVRGTDEATYVYVADPKQQKAFRRRVTVGELSAQAVTIRQGLSAGEAVIVAGQHQLTDGQAILPQ